MNEKEIVLKLTRRQACAVATLCAAHNECGGIEPPANVAGQVENKLAKIGVGKWDYHTNYAKKKEVMA